ncbi:beta-lactamase family protein [Streptomyces scopuliridis]|uniref:Beta-lactamase family protein n=2 Tax=Streptomyces scopuliridis TaxID=452529 RepID=A0ACD4ZYT5_9ACTN|nr:serine hydrolase domain-containing protein [Streptomyces scopuliridis]WSC02212.1 beta-lactamase family protein [Streptomyces scopuliridis]WSC04251.1 beta-lactamase family protein [Streptomyces scopuliridis]
MTLGAAGAETTGAGTSEAGGAAMYMADADGGPRPPDWARRPADAIRAAAPRSRAVAVALRHGDRRAVVTYGSTSHHGGIPVTADTRFEIGSLTKCFTALLLAEQVARGEVAYGDPLARFLPPEALPRPRGGPITLLHLATHTSGLPRLPPGLLGSAAADWFSNPYARFSTADLLRALARTRPHARPGERVRYSNFGVGLLGHLLTRAAPVGRQGYGDLLAARVLGPLGLSRTSCGPDLPQATGYWHGRARPPWLIPGLAGAGAVRSSARDLLGLLDAVLDAAPDTPSGSAPSVPVPAPVPVTLRTALVDVVRPRLALRDGGKRLALIWNIRVRPDGDVYHHSGGTRGFSAFAGFSPRHRTALVALTNTTPAADQAFIQSAYNALLSLARPV